MPSTIDEMIGRRIHRRRRLMGLTQREVGERIGVRFQQIQKYECGANRVSAATLFLLAEALQTTMGYFFDEGSQSAQDGDDQEGSDTYDLLRAFRKIQGPPRQRLLSLARALALPPPLTSQIAPSGPHGRGVACARQASSATSSSDDLAGPNGAAAR